MRQDERTDFVQALERARRSAYPHGEFAGQESFMRAGEILDLAHRAGVGPRVSVLDLCCGVAGPGRLIAAELGCTYLGRDYSADAIAIARGRTADLDCRFEIGQVPPVPDGPFDVVLLLETLLAFEDKARLIDEVARALLPGGRFALTVEEGRPLDDAERHAMPDADTVWPIPLAELTELLADVGLRVGWQQECTAAHREMAEALREAFVRDAESIARQVGTRALDDLLAAHRLWGDWLHTGRIRKFALVAEKGW